MDDTTLHIKESKEIGVQDAESCSSGPYTDEYGTPPASPSLPQKPRSRLRMFAVLGGLSLSLFIAALDVAIVSTIIPTVSSDLGSANGYTWLGGAFLLANAGAGPIWAKLSDIWGRKAILLAADVMFFIGSLLCALSVNMTMLIAARAVQGAAGGGMVLLVNIAICDLYSMRDRTLYLGLLECMWALAGGLGPLLGGAFSQYISWRWCFWINLPLSGVTFLLLLLFLDVHNPRTKMAEGLRAIDWLGCFSIMAVTLMLLLGLDFGGVTFPWNSPIVICLIVLGVLMTGVFVFAELRVARYPLIPLSLFRYPSNVASLLVCFAHGFVWMGADYYLPLYFQSVKGAAPLRSGLLLLPYGISGALMGIVTGIVIHRTGRYRELTWAGLALMTLGNGLYIMFGADTSTAAIVTIELVAAIGVGMLFEPPLIAIQTLIAQDDVATATGTLAFFRSLATSCSVVIGGVVFQNGMLSQTANLQSAGLSAELIQQLSGGDAAASVIIISTISDPVQQAVVKEAFAWSLRNLWILYTIMGICGCIASVFVVKRDLSEEHTETKTGIKRKLSLVVGGV